MPPSVEDNEARPKTTVRRTIQKASVAQKQKGPGTRSTTAATAESRPVVVATGMSPKKVAPQAVAGATAQKLSPKKASPQTSLSAADALAKQRGRPPSAAASRPGSFRVNSSASGPPITAAVASSSTPRQFSQAERDAQAKSAARAVTARTMSGDVAAAATAPGVRVVHRADSAASTSSRPGAVRVDSGDGLQNAVLGKMARAVATTTPATSTNRSLTSDVRAKQQARPQVVVSKPGAVHATGGGSATAAPVKVSSTSSATPTPLSQFERDVQAKKSARGSSAGGRSTPGAVPVDVTSAGLETAVMRKARAAGGAATTTTAAPGAVQVDGATAGGLEDAVMRKSRTVSTSSAAATSASAQRKLTQLERDALSKNSARRSSPTAAGASTPGAVSTAASLVTDLNSLENAVAGKVRRADGATSSAMNTAATSARAADLQSNLTQLESDVSAKVTRGAPASRPGAVPARTMSGDLDALEGAVANKIRSSGANKNGGASAAVEEVNTGLTQMESDVMAKARSATSSRGGRRASEKGDRTELEKEAAKAETVMEIQANAKEDKEKAKENDAPVTPRQGMKDGQNAGGGTGPLAPDLAFGSGDGFDGDGLAVAVAIEEDANEAHVDGIAIEYDPDAKPPFHKTRLFRKSALIAFLVILAAGAAAIAGILLTADEGGETTPYRETLGIREEIESAIGAEQLETFESPYSKALDWIIHKDPMEVVPADSNFFQRYITAYLYFATTVDGLWRSCNPPEGNQLDMCYFTHLLSYAHPPEFEKRQATRWLSKQHECQFAGVVCDDDKRILEIKLNGAGMSGTFPTGIIYLPFLQTVRFASGTLRGPLPTEPLLSLKHLAVIDLKYNDFTGEIPMEWWETRKLIEIDLDYNKLEGTLPAEIENMKDLKYLYLHDNQLSGPIPTQFGSLANLKDLIIGHNDFEGPIPTELGKMSSIEDLRMDRNLLTGTLPTELGNLRNLQEIRVSENTRLGGTIPEEFWQLDQMLWLEMFSCNFTGPISPSIANMADMFLVRMNDNAFSGTIPVEFAVEKLDLVEIQNNNLVGNMPEQVCDLISAGNAYTQGLGVLVADCGADPSTGEVQLSCDCCTTCCADGVCKEEISLTEEWGNRKRLR